MFMIDRRLLAILSCLIVAVVCSAKEEKRPNFLFVLVDDQSPFDLKVYNRSSILDSPVIARLASEGMVFDGAYHMGSWAGAVCTPSRHMIMSGRTVWHLPRRGAKKSGAGRSLSLAPANLADNTLAAVFNRAGYDTMRTCKNGNSYAAANEQFTVSRTATKRGGTKETGSAWHADQVLDYLDDRKSDAPFLIYLGFSHPHDTRDGTEDLLSKYGAVNHRDRGSLPPGNSRQPSLPANYLPVHPFHHGHPNLRD